MSNSSSLVSTTVLKSGAVAKTFLQTTGSDRFYAVVIPGLPVKTFVRKANADRFVKDRGVSYSVKGCIYDVVVKELATGASGSIVAICTMTGDFIVRLKDGSKASISPLQCHPV